MLLPVQDKRNETEVMSVQVVCFRVLLFVLFWRDLRKEFYLGIRKFEHASVLKRGKESFHRIGSSSEVLGGPLVLY